MWTFCGPFYHIYKAILFNDHYNDNNAVSLCRKFSGFALSHKDWEDELDYLIEDLSNQADVDNSGTYYTAGYDGKEQIPP